MKAKSPFSFSEGKRNLYGVRYAGGGRGGLNNVKQISAWKVSDEAGIEIGWRLIGQHTQSGPA